MSGWLVALLVVTGFLSGYNWPVIRYLFFKGRKP